jgi:small-conductance mechanosensitive channel
LLQPFVNYNFPGGFYLTSAPIITADWKADSSQRWTVPLGGGIGKIFHLGKLPVNSQISAYYNVVRPDNAANWQIRVQAQQMWSSSIARATLTKWRSSAFVRLPSAALLGCAALACLLPTPAVLAQSSSVGRSADVSAVQGQPANVVVFNRKVAVLRAHIFGVTPAERASRAQQTIRTLLKRGGPGAVTVQSAPQGSELLIDGDFALILVPEDADRASGESFESMTRSVAQALQRAIEATRQARDHGQMLRAAAYSAAATLAFALAVWGIGRLRQALVAHSARRLASSTAQVKVVGLQVLHPTHLHGAAQWLLRLLSWMIVAVLAYEWLAYVLTRFPYTRVWGEDLDDFLLGVLQHIADGVLHALPDLVVALVIFLLARGVIGVARPLFDRIKDGGDGLGWIDQDLAVPTRRIFSVAVWLFAVAMAYPYLPGAQGDAFKGISVLVGLMLTLGGAGVVGQGVSGLILMYSRTIRVGEHVRINDQEGTVTELGTFTTKIRTGMGEEVTLPNALIMSSITKNYSRTLRGHGYVLDAVLTIGYGTPWRQVEAMLVEAAGRTEGVLAAPPAKVFQTSLSDFYIEYRLVCHAIPSKPYSRAEVMHMLHANVLDVFNEHNVQIMSPHYMSDPHREQVVPKSQWYAAPAKNPEDGPPGR